MDKKTDFIQIRVTPKEKEILKREAEKNYMKLTSFLLKPFKKLLRGK